MPALMIESPLNAVCCLLYIICWVFISILQPGLDISQTLLVFNIHRIDYTLSWSSSRVHRYLEQSYIVENFDDDKGRPESLWAMKHISWLQRQRVVWCCQDNSRGRIVKINTLMSRVISELPFEVLRVMSTDLLIKVVYSNLIFSGA